MKNLISFALVSALSFTPAMAQQANYTSINQLTQAAQQAATGQLSMVHGGFLGGGLSAAPVQSVARTGEVSRPVAASATGSNNSEDDATALIAVTIGAAALLIPVAISLLGDD